MKTAMQELIDDLDRTLVKSIFERLEKEGLFNKALEKEKEQIMEAYRYGHIDGFTSANHLGTEFENEEEYYHQTYNQNK
jgi:hypothetical protein